METERGTLWNERVERMSRDEMRALPREAHKAKYIQIEAPRS